MWRLFVVRVFVFPWLVKVRFVTCLQDRMLADALSDFGVSLHNQPYHATL